MAAVAAVLGLAAGAVILTIARRRLGGITGDVLGATIEIVMTATLVALALL
jgi:adenosylcobinamide-GDP ribazoletransferase